jgi:hypothetical protein
MEISMRFRSLELVRATKARNHTGLKNLGVQEPSLTYFTRLRMPPQDATVNTEISSRLACFAVALMMNGLIFAGMNYLFNGPIRHHSAGPRIMVAVALQVTPGVTIVTESLRKGLGVMIRSTASAPRTAPFSPLRHASRATPANTFSYAANY